VNIKGGWAFFLTSREVKFCDHLKKIGFMSTKRLGFVVSIERGHVLKKGCALEGSHMLEKG